MIDEQIIKWWEDEIHLAEYVDSDYRDGIKVEYIKAILDLINRQQAEIEELRNIVKADLLTAKEDFKLSISDISKIRAEAIKEFESKVIEMAYIDNYFDLVVNVASIEAIAKEMVGDDK